MAQNRFFNEFKAKYDLTTRLIFVTKVSKEALFNELGIA